MPQRVIAVCDKEVVTREIWSLPNPLRVKPSKPLAGKGGVSHQPAFLKKRAHSRSFVSHLVRSSYRALTIRTVVF